MAIAGGCSGVLHQLYCCVISIVMITSRVTVLAMKTFGEFARQRIKRLGKSQKSLASTLGVSPAYVSQVLTGKKNPPDLGRQRNRWQLKVWSEFLGVVEDEVLDVVRFQLHRVPPRPKARYAKMRQVLLSRLESIDADISEEIRALELHPAENMVIGLMVQVFLVLHEENLGDRSHALTRFKEMCVTARSNKDFIEGDLARFFSDRPFSWIWDSERNDVRLYSDSSDIRQSLDRIDELLGKAPVSGFRRTAPVVGHVSAGEGFEYTDGGFPAGEGFDRVEIPPGVDPRLSTRLYCVRVRGDSLREFINEGATLFIKPESWEEIKDGDLVIFKDRSQNRAFVKKVEFSGDNLILKSMNSQYRNIVLSKSELSLLERVLSVVF